MTGLKLTTVGSSTGMIFPRKLRAVHQWQLAEHGGTEGLQDAGLLASALTRPVQRHTYRDPPADLAALAADAYGIASNPPFVGGNKRTALVVCRVFLLLNECDVKSDQAEKYHVLKYHVFIALPDRRLRWLSEEELTAWIRNHVAPAPSRPSGSSP